MVKVVKTAQVLGGAGLAAGATVGALIAQQLLGGEQLVGLSTGLLTLGSAATAYLIGRGARRRGRRPVLAAGFVAGGLGAVGVIVATVTANVALLFAALFVYGAGSATNLQARYAATDLAPADRRGQATSSALVWTTAGAVAGPSLVEPLGVLAMQLGLPRLTGMFVLAAAAYTVAGLTLFVFLRPDPLLLSRRLWHPGTPSDGARHQHGPQAGLARFSPQVKAGAATMVLTQMSMVAIMTMTPVAMYTHGHGLGDVGLVIGAHIAAMYLPSPLSGRLTDRVGRTPTALAAVAVLVLAGLLAAVGSGGSLFVIVAALALLGLGWNLGLISGTALVVDGTTPANRPQIQGGIDVAVALSGAVAGTLSSVISAAWGYGALCLLFGGLSVALLPTLRATSRPLLVE